jgi:hypothetical protein
MKYRLWFMYIILSFALVTAGCGKSAKPAQPDTYPITFGVYSDDQKDELKETRTIFTPDESIVLDFSYPPKFGVKQLTVQIQPNPSKTNSPKALEWKEIVKPNWNGLQYEFHIPEEDGQLAPGKYKVRILKKKKVIGKGSFRIEKAKHTKKTS